MFDISKDNLLKDFIKFPKKNLLIILLLLGFGEWFVSDLIHFAGGSIGFFALCLGGYFYLKNDKPKFNEPNNLDGWINLCNEDLNFFEELEATNELEKQNSKRQKILESILNRFEKEKISCIGQKDYQSCQSVLKSYFKEDKFDFDLFEKLPKYSSSEIIPEIVYRPLHPALARIKQCFNFKTQAYQSFSDFLGIVGRITQQGGVFVSGIADD